MTSTEAIVFINSIFAGTPDGEVEFVATEPVKLPAQLPAGAFAIRITARARGEKAVSLCVFAFGPRETESDQQSTMTTSTARIALELINVLERKIHDRKVSKAKNN